VGKQTSGSLTLHVVVYSLHVSYLFMQHMILKMALVLAFVMYFTRLFVPVFQYGSRKSREIALSCRLCDN
jgi:hypothetical protein